MAVPILVFCNFMNATKMELYMVVVVVVVREPMADRICSFDSVHLPNHFKLNSHNSCKLAPVEIARFVVFCQHVTGNTVSVVSYTPRPLYHRFL